MSNQSKRIITEHDIIAARQRVAAAEANNEQQDFADALLASPDLMPEMVRKWLDADVHVHWCDCEDGDTTPRIVCKTCGLPPYWIQYEEPAVATSFTDDQLKPVEPTEKPIVHGSNVRHRTSEELADSAGVVNRITGSVPGKRQIGVSWKVEGKLLPEKQHPEAELENTD